MPQASLGFFNEVGTFIKTHEANEDLKPLLAPLKQALGQLQQATMWFMQNAMAKPDNAGAGSYDYMHLFGLVALGYMWAEIARAALVKKAADATQASRMDAKILTAKFFMARMMPETGAHLARITSGADNVMALPVDAF